MPVKQRKDYIDRLKGIGILCVVIGHFIAVFREEVIVQSDSYRAGNYTVLHRLLFYAASLVLAVVTVLLLSAEPVSKAVNGIFGYPYRFYLQKRKAAETAGQNGEKR